jgi:hypothetical protein
MATPTLHFFPTITNAVVGTSAAGATMLTLTLDGVGTVEITLEQLLRPKRFAKAILKQTGVVVQPPQPAVWKMWLVSCVRQARLRGDVVAPPPPAPFLFGD